MISLHCVDLPYGEDFECESLKGLALFLQLC